MQVLCVIRRFVMSILVAASVVLAIGLFPHPTTREAQAMMYISSAIAIVSLGLVWRRPKKIQA
jgi:hypothetical protein